MAVPVETRPIAFGLSSASERDIALLVPPGRRHVSYDWDRVPYRGSHIQVLRSCDYYRFVLRVPPVTSDRWWCWDTGQRTLLQFPDADEFSVVVRNHPDWVWLVANEPDVDDQDNLSSEQYAEFLGHVAAIVAKNLESDNPATAARLVFCQISSPTRKEYCQQTYFILKALFARRHWPDWPASVNPADVIHAISVHNYLSTYYSACDTEASRCYGSQLEEHHLEATAAQWTRAMNDFARWAHQFDGQSLANKPLWLTEFGALAAFCPRALTMRPGADRVGGIGCPHAAARQNGQQMDDFVFYGRNEREGLWGAQRATLTYLLNPTRETSGNGGEWVAAWWFNTRIDWLDRGECAVTGWLFGHDVDCTRDLDKTSRAGETFRDTLACLASSTRCPERIPPAADP
jgi:hypothetical protein